MGKLISLSWHILNFTNQVVKMQIVDFNLILSFKYVWLGVIQLNQTVNTNYEIIQLTYTTFFFQCFLHQSGVRRSPCQDGDSLPLSFTTAPQKPLGDLTETTVLFDTVYVYILIAPSLFSTKRQTVSNGWTRLDMWLTCI